MSSEWHTLKFSDAPFCIIDGDRGANYPKQHDFSSLGYCLFLNAGNVTNNGFSFSDCAFITQEKDSVLRKGKLVRHDLILTTRGTVGNVAYYSDAVAYKNIRINSGMVIFRPNITKIIPYYLYLFLRSRTFREQVAYLTSGSAQPQLPIRDMNRIEMPLPPLGVQQEICNVLGALDDRIALLRETNATLEAIAQALFKSWFVDFEPVHAKARGEPPQEMDDATAALFPDSFEESELGMIPKGWKVGPIGDAVECVGGGTPNTKSTEFWEPEEFAWTTPKDLSGIQSPVLLETERKLSAIGLAKVSSGLLPIGSLLMSSRAPIGYLAITQIPVAINQGYIAMLPGGSFPPFYLLFWCQQNMEVIKNHANGSTFMEISKKAFRPLPAIIPDESVISAFTNLAEPLFARLVANEQQAQTLAQLRDTLLPKLISGQVRLPEAEALLAEETLP